MISPRGAARRAALLLLLLAAGAAPSCAHYPHTVPLTVAPAPPPRYTFDQLPAPPADDDLFVCLAFSGGGTRAASLSYGVLQKLRDTPIVRARDGRHESLLDEVDCISSVSGGSFTAAYYALFGQRIFQDYRKAFLERNIQGDLAWRAVNPLAWPRLMSPYFSRIDLAAELYGEAVFEGKTYADLIKANRRPFIILNSTDLSTGDGFEFTQDQFDLIGSDLGPFPVARAVAASSAFPFLLAPVSLENHAVPGFIPPLTLVHGAGDYFKNRRRFIWSTHQLTYLDKPSTPFVHVMDGGLADNIGLRAIERQLWDPTGFIARRFNTGKTSKMIFIVVNSKSGLPDTYNEDESPPGLPDVALKTATIAMDNYTYEVIELLRDLKTELEHAQKDAAHCKQVARNESDCPSFAHPFEVHVVDVALDAMPDPARRKRLLSIGTSFSLSSEEVQLLIDAAGELLDKNPDFQKLLTSLRTPAPPPAPVPATPPPAAAPAP